MEKKTLIEDNDTKCVQVLLNILTKELNEPLQEEVVEDQEMHLSEEGEQESNEGEFDFMDDSEGQESENDELMAAME